MKIENKRLMAFMIAVTAVTIFLFVMLAHVGRAMAR